MKQVRWILLLSLIVLFLIVVFQNLEATKLQLVFFTFEPPLALLLSITLALGFVLGLLAPAMWKVRNWRNSKSKSDGTSETQEASANNVKSESEAESQDEKASEQD
ncbi:MAG: LapA family protein [Planctomycetota bacterium]